MTEVAPNAIDIAGLGADVQWTDGAAEATARAEGTADGRLAEILEWAAATQGRFPPTLPTRARCVVFGPVPDSLAAFAASLDVGLRAVEVEEEASVAEAFAVGTDAADAEVDSGTDLLVVADPDSAPAAAVLVGLLTGAEPVSLLPRGAQAIDTAAWIERAEHLRDARRRVAELRALPDHLLTALEHPPLAATLALVLRAVARRTPVLLDGTATVAAALLAADTQPRASRWWRIADACPDPVHARAAQELTQRPLLDLGVAGGRGTAGVLALALLRAAILTGAPNA